MFSGKTTTLMTAIKRAAVGLRRICVIKYAADARYGRGPMATSHDGLSMRALEVSTLEQDPPALPADVECIAVDEGQFMAGLDAFCMRHNARGRDVIVAALNAKGDAPRSPWPFVQELIPHATHIQMMHATCIVCQGIAECSRSLAAAAAVGDGIRVGGDELYVATCAGCYTRDISADTLERRRAAVQRIKE
jgi:thymidine kinase